MGADADRAEALPDCEPFDGSSKYHSVWGDADCKNAYFLRFSCYCEPCYKNLACGGDFKGCKTRTKVGVYKNGAYCNDPIKMPILPKKPSAAARRTDAKAYSDTLKKDSWVAVDCTGGEDVHGFWLAQCTEKPYKATADITAPVGMKDIKKGWAVVDVEWWARYDDDDDTLFKLEGIADTVHTESLIVVDAPLDVQKVPHRRNKVQLSADSKSAVREGLELRHPTGTPEWFYT